MRPLQSAAYLSVIAVAVVVSAGQALAWPLVTAYRATEPPRLDGALDDACWQAASVCQPFITATAAEIEAQSQVRTCWDDDSIYVAFECLDRFLDPRLQQTDRVRAQQTRHDSNVFSDDCIEVFLDVPEAGVLHFASNSIGTRWEARNGDSAWDCDWQVKAVRQTDRYVVECAIPLTALGARGLGGTEWQGNFCRERTAVEELSTWSGLKGAFKDTSQFGTIRFAEAGPALERLALDKVSILK